MTESSCVLCRGSAADDELQRVQVWENALWRLTMSVSSETPGFSYLEPKRHIRSIADLDGEEVLSFGDVMAFASRNLRLETAADAVYVYIFGDGVPHLHVHLAPHVSGDALNDQIIRGVLKEEKMPNGFTMFVSSDYPPLPRSDLEALAARVKRRMADPS